MLGGQEQQNDPEEYHARLKRDPLQEMVRIGDQSERERQGKKATDPMQLVQISEISESKESESKESESEAKQKNDEELWIELKAIPPMDTRN
mmetsp:Transcript_33742/g.44511  ORF Transcript_33742/g.44511 Transcript_33742/m.44511 type:complete len:92 (+) Transcript_33742:1540-1815(+)